MTERLSEPLAVWFKRYQEAREAGLIPEEAKAWAESEQDVGELRRLVRDGCPLEQLRLIVL